MKRHMTVPSNPETATVNNATLRTLRQFSPLFPEVAAVAEFRPRSQTIHLHQISRAALRDSFANEIAFAENRRAWQTVIHELNHWADLCTTLWGRRHLMSLLNAYAAIEGSEEGYWRVIQHYDEERRILFPEYYRYVIPGSSRHSPERPWTIDYSAGREFSPDGKMNSGQPIFFTTFGEHETREKIARQPLSIGSLLEIRAVYAELLTGIAQGPPSPSQTTNGSSGVTTS